MKDSVLPEIKIKFKKKRLYYTVIILFSSFCIFSISTVSLFAFLIEYFPSIEFIILLFILLCLISLILLILLKSIIKNEFAIILSNEGIFENTHFGSIGFINWDDIENVDYNYYLNRSSIKIRINEDKYIDYIKNQKNTIKKIYLNMFIEEYSQQDIFIAEVYIDYDFDEFNELFCKYYLNSKE